MLFSNHRGSITWHFIGGNGVGEIAGSPLGINSPGQRCNLSSIIKPSKNIRNMGISTLGRRLRFEDFCGHMNTNFDPPERHAQLFYFI